MKKASEIIEGGFVTTRFVNEDFHNNNSQMIHSHEDELELLYVMRGTGSYLVHNHQYIVGPGSLIICNGRVPHGEIPSQAHYMESICLVMEKLKIEGLEDNSLIHNSQLPVLFFDEDRQLIESLFTSLHMLNRDGDRYREACGKLANAIVSLVYTKLCERSQSSYNRNKEGKGDLIQRVTAYMDDNLREEITLQKLGEKFHISRFHLGHIYKMETGISPMKYLLYRRIGECQNRLMNTELPVGIISDEMGFSDNSHFNKMFKKYVGMTPTQYRKYYREKSSDWT